MSKPADLYSISGVPLPRLSASERARRRLAWRNERKLYRRRCSASGKNIVSIFDEGCPFPVYSQELWWSDRWDPLSFGRAYNVDLPFFKQFTALFNVVPQCALRAPQSENCEYTNQCEKNKDCYLVFCSNNSRGCLYGMWFQSCNDCLDCTYLQQSELCYELLNGKNCYACSDSENLQNCSDCHFSSNLIGCSNCIGCVNLRNKQYWLFNQPLSKSEYFRAVAELKLHSRSARALLAQQIAEVVLKCPQKFYAGRNNEGFSGDYLEDNKNAYECFNCRNSENIFFCRDAWSARNSLDLTETLEQDFCIELEGCYRNTNCGFSAKISETSDVWYSSHCFSSSNLFACIGLTHKQYCILNVQYSKEEYFSLRDKIVEQMKRRGEWGEFFPLEDSPFAYNESVAQEYFPLTKAEALREGLRWKDEVIEKSSQKLSPPDSILDVTENILDAVFTCEQSGRAFKLQKRELELYRQLQIPLPAFHHDERHQRRMNKRWPREILKRNCFRCSAELLSNAPARLHNVLCEDCFTAQVD